jgi:iron complex outermembrane receptor protein
MAGLGVAGLKAAGLAVAVAAAPSAALAQSATPGATVHLAPVTVEGHVESPEEQARERLEATPGGTGLIVSEDLRGKADVTLSDALGSVPGVVVQDFFGGNDQPRIQIRGSGLQQNPVERGVLMLQDGLPINRADGSYIVGLAAPGQAERIEVYRGSTANRLGAAMLGGALNFVSPTGTSAPGVAFSADGGSFGYHKGAVRAGGRLDAVDGLIQAERSERDGFRDYNSSERASLDANIGADLSGSVRTRVFLGYTDLGFDVAGPLTKDGLEAYPKAVHGGPTVVGGVAQNPGPNVLRDLPRRESEQVRLGNRTSFTHGAHLLDAAFGYTQTEDSFAFPISSGIRDVEGGDLTVVGRYAYAPDPAAVLPLADVSLRYVYGTAERNDYINLSGEAGPLFGRNDLEATTLSLHAGANVPLGGGLTLSPAVTYARATRDSTDTFPGATRPTVAYNPANPTARLPDGSVPAQDTSYAHTYSAVSPSLGLSYRPHRDHLVFGTVSRSFEPPTHEDLLATVNGTPNSSAGRPSPGAPALAADAYRTPDLDAQTATTVEAGWRGRVGPVGVDAVGYYSWVSDELLSLRDATGASLGAINAEDTRHLGLELGITADLSDSWSGRLAYTFQDFHFQDDPLRGDNDLAGAPPHVVALTVRYQVAPALAVATDIDWRPVKTPVDNMNTLYADPYATVALRGDYQITEEVMVHGEVRNLFDETYAASTLIVDQARADQAAFLPGDGRAFYMGLRAAF